MVDAQGSALTRFHKEYRPALMAFFLRRVHNMAAAEDLTQEVFIRVAGRGDATMRSPDAFIFQVAANLLRDHARRMQVRTEHAAAVRCAEWTGTETLDPFRVASGRQELASLKAGLAELPERTRQIFLLFRYENVDQRTIADSFGISVSAVEKHLRRAMVRLLARMGEPE